MDEMNSYKEKRLHVYPLYAKDKYWENIEE